MDSSERYRNAFRSAVARRGFRARSLRGFWKITDHGDAAPRWKLAGPKSTLINPRGVAPMPAHKQIVVSDMSLNALVTFYFPEIF